MALTAKQLKFVQEYLADPNATQAAIRAGYSKSTARQMGAENLSKPDIAAAIRAGQEKHEKTSGVTREWALQRLKLEAEDDSESSTHSARVSAVGLAMKYLGMLKEDGPNPNRPKFDFSKLTPEKERELRVALESLIGPLA